MTTHIQDTLDRTTTVRTIDEQIVLTLGYTPTLDYRVPAWMHPLDAVALARLIVESVRCGTRNKFEVGNGTFITARAGLTHGGLGVCIGFTDAETGLEIDNDFTDPSALEIASALINQAVTVLR